MKFFKREVKAINGKPMHEVRATIGTGDDRVQIRRRFASAREANLYIDSGLAQDLESERAKKVAGPNPLTTRSFGSEFDFWCSVKKNDWSPGYYVSIRQYARDFGERLSKLSVEEVRPQFVRGLEAELKARGDANETIRRKIGMIKAVLNHSVEMERIPYNPVARYKMPRKGESDVQFWEASEAKSFLDFAFSKYPSSGSDYWIYVAYLIALNTAVRSGELWSLRPRCLRPSLNTIQVTEQYHSVSRTFRTLKGKEGRTAPLGRDLNDAIQLLIRSKKLGLSDLLFTNKVGRPIDHNNFYDRVFLKDIEAWGGRKIKFHGLRHTAATMMLDQGVNVRVLQRILGHKDLETTERYIHSLGRSVGDAAEIFALLPTLLPNQNHQRLKLKVSAS